MKRLLLFSVVALAGLPAFAQQQPDTFVRPYWWDKPVVEGLGRAQMDVSPNRARFDLAFVETDNQSDAATKKAVARAKIAYEAIHKVAGDKARVNTSVNVTAYYEQYKDKQGNIQTNDRADQVKGYEARVSMSVVLTDTSLAGRARAAALALGPQDSGRISIYLEQTAEMQRDILAEAAKDARQRATATASAAGGKLGDILVVQEGTESCLGNWSSSQVARLSNPDRAYRYSAPMAAPPPPPPPPPAPPPVASGMVGNRTVTITEKDLAALDLPSDPNPSQISANVCVIYTLLK
ncbi:MAG TPA: SIMPL domain-containing protein [Hyphomonadaceae bacterium]|nr:SIMPL domain-containing protein [Hyphomonadaceae bacterium]